MVLAETGEFKWVALRYFCCSRRKVKSIATCDVYYL